MKMSTKGRAKLTKSEGVVLKAYLDQGGIATLGTGFTNASPIVTQFLKSIGVPGGKIVAGKTTITREQNDSIFAAILEAEYEPPVNRFNNSLPDNLKLNQDQFDALVSAVYNAGPKILSDSWSKLYREGKVEQAIAKFKVTRITANGKKSAGLERRRREEGDWFLTGYEGKHKMTYEARDTAPSQPDPVVKEAQEALNKINPGSVVVDGFYGPRTKQAIMRYQSLHPHLKVDGILGPATIQQLMKDKDVVGDIITKTVLTSGASGAAASAGGGHGVWILFGVAVAIVVGGYLIYKYRDVLQRKWHSVTQTTPSKA